MKILLIGPQGSGKGTLGPILSNHLEIPFVSGGDLLRDLPKSSSYYDEVCGCMEKGLLVPLDIMSSIVQDRLSQEDCVDGFILDGWCRRLEDLRAFDPEVDIVLVVDISRETSIKRITGRRLCTSDGKTYNIYTLPKEKLEECTGELIQREDDTKEAVEVRLNIYYIQTQEVIDYFEKKGILKVIDGEALPDKVFQNALNALESFSNLL